MRLPTKSDLLDIDMHHAMVLMKKSKSTPESCWISHEYLDLVEQKRQLLWARNGWMK